MIEQSQAEADLRVCARLGLDLDAQVAGYVQAEGFDESGQTDADRAAALTHLNAQAVAFTLV